MQLKGLADILQLGHPLLYEECAPVLESELSKVPEWIAHLDNAMEEIRAKYHFGRGIAAPQLGIMKRVVYINIDRPITMINPTFLYKSDELFELWDDCMSFPNLLVRVMRHKKINVQYRDQNWQLQEWTVSDSIAELLQHEMDHLDGILCTMRAVNDKAFRWRR